MAKITVIIEGGAVKDVDGIPTDVYLEVRNYDVGKIDDKYLTTDEDGRACEVLEWRAPE